MMKKSDILKLKSRKEIYDFIKKNPGLKVRELSRKLDIPKTTLLYHIRYLEKIELVNEKKVGKSKLVYASKEIGKKEKELLEIIRDENTCKIFIYLCFSITFSTVEISKELKVNHNTASYHIKKLLDLDIIEEVEVKNGSFHPFKNNNIVFKRNLVKSEKLYRGKNWSRLFELYNIMILHKHSMFDEKIIEEYMDYLKEGERKHIKSFNSMIDSIYDTFLDLFKPPFCS